MQTSTVSDEEIAGSLAQGLSAGDCRDLLQMQASLALLQEMLM